MKQFTFIYNNRRYITLVGGSSSFDEICPANSNAADYNKLAVTNYLISQFITEFGMSFTNAAPIENPVVTMDGEAYHVTGTYTDENGFTAPIEVLKDKILVNGKDISIEELSDTAVLEEDEKVDEQSNNEEHAIESTINMEETAVMEETTVMEDTASVEDSTDVVSEVDDSIAEDEQEVEDIEPIAEEVKFDDSITEEVVTIDTIEDTEDEHEVSIDTTEQRVINTNTIQPAFDIERQLSGRSRMPVGFYFGSYNDESIEEEEDVMGNLGASPKIGFMLPDDKVVGFKLGEPKKPETSLYIGAVSTDQSNIGMQMHKAPIEEPEVAVEIPARTSVVRTPAKPVENADEEIVIKPFVKANNPKPVEKPVPIVPTKSVITKDNEDEKKDVVTAEEKEEVLSKLQPELRDIIVRIPVTLLSNIEEFTTNPIDMTALESQGQNYCIEKRWKKSGNWFCIDAVNEMKRYFYNKNEHVSMGISIATIRACYKVLK